MKVLISGASGFVGKNLLSELLHSCQISTIGRANSDYSWQTLQNVTHDFEAYIHLAGLAHDTSNVNSVEMYHEINTGLTIKLFDHFVKSNATKFIFVSTVKAAADTVDGLLTEETLPNPKTPYGLSKLKAEEYILGTKLPIGKSVIVLRPCMIYGPLNKGKLNALVKLVDKGIPYPFATFRNSRSFLFVGNLTYIIKAIIESEKPITGVYNVADDEQLSTMELIENIASLKGKKVRTLKLPRFFFTALAKLGSALRLPFNSHVLDKIVGDFKVSNKKLKKMLELNSMPFSVQEGLSKTISRDD